MVMECIYSLERINCEKKEKGVCPKHCIRYIKTDDLMRKSGIPWNKVKNLELSTSTKTDAQAFSKLMNIAENIEEFVDSGKDLYLYSSGVGNGKTTWGIKLILNYFSRIWYPTSDVCRGLFVHLPTFFSEYKRNLPIEKYSEFDEYLENIKNADIVVFDDLGVVPMSKFEYGELLSIIEIRNLNGRSCIYTGNLNRDKLSEYVGERIVSRIVGSSWEKSTTVIEFIGKDRRHTK